MIAKKNLPDNVLLLVFAYSLTDMRVVKIVFFLLTVCAGGAKAQTNFLRGYYITMQHDTVRGYIESRTPARNLMYCAFKANEKAKPTILTPYEIAGFSVMDQDYYEVHSLKKAESDEQELLIFKVLIKGKVNLLSLDNRFFASTDDGKWYEITNGVVIEDGYSKKDFVGLHMLRWVMQECPNVYEMLDKQANYDENRYKEIFRQYYACSGGTYLETKRPKIPAHVGFDLQGFVGATTGRLTTQDQEIRLDAGSTFGAGVSASVFLPRINERLRLNMEANLVKYSNYDYFSNAGINNDLYCDFTALHLPMFLRYTTRPLFFDLGVQNQAIISQEIQWRQEHVTPTKVETSDGNIDPIGPWGMGVLAGVGAQVEVGTVPVRALVRYSPVRAEGDHGKSSFSGVHFVVQVQLLR